MKTSEILDQAADQIERYGWLQNDWWEAEVPTEWKKCKVCAGGGINAAAGYVPDYDEHDGTHEPVARAFEVMARRVNPYFTQGGPWLHVDDFTEAVADWNDAEDRTAEQVIAELRAAAASEREQGR